MVDGPLRVWVLSDGQPGHYNQSRGIVSALRRILPVQEYWIETRLRAGLNRSFLRLYLNNVQRAGSLKLLEFFYKIDAVPETGCDLIVSAGGKTSFANAWLARLMKVSNVYAGSLRRLSPQLFSVVVTLEAIPGAASNLVVPLPPSAIDPDVLFTKGEEFKQRLGLAEGRYWLLLLGGDGAGFRYQEKDWLALLRLLEVLSELHGVKWLIASSRRTGAKAERLLRRRLDPAVFPAQCWYGAGDEYRPEDWLAAAERIFVSEDSMTMLTEAICSRRPVYSLRPRHAAPNDRYKQALMRFSEQGLLCRFALAELSQQPGLLDRQSCRVLEESPLQSLADSLRKRLRLT
jgi:mitochondrial fission protein ELM1